MMHHHRMLMVVLGTEIFTIPGSRAEKLRKNVFVTDYHFQLFFSLRFSRPLGEHKKVSKMHVTVSPC